MLPVEMNAKGSQFSSSITTGSDVARNYEIWIKLMISQ